MHKYITAALLHNFNNNNPDICVTSGSEQQ